MKKMESCITGEGINGDYDKFENVEDLISFYPVREIVRSDGSAYNLTQSVRT